MNKIDLIVEKYLGEEYWRPESKAYNNGLDSIGLLPRALDPEGYDAATRGFYNGWHSEMGTDHEPFNGNKEYHPAFHVGQKFGVEHARKYKQTPVWDRPGKQY